MIFLIGLDDERSLIYDRINTRVDKMVEHGLLEEAKWLYDNYPDAQSARGIGYKELFPYFAGNQTLDEALEKLKQNTRRFAKRQLTWFRNRMTVKFYQISSPEYPENVVQDLELFLNDREGRKGRSILVLKTYLCYNKHNKKYKPFNTRPKHRTGNTANKY